MKFAFFVFFTFTFLLAGGQDCTDFHQYQCTYGDYSFFYSRQSKSFLTAKGQKTDVKIVAYEGEDYYLAVCGNKKFLPIRFQIIEDDGSENILYDNKNNDYQESIIFSNEATRNLIVRILIPEGTPNESKDYKCVGLVVQFRKTK